MSGILFGKANKGNANTVTKYTQLDINTSAYGLPITIGWGAFRIAPQLIWAGLFQAIPQKSAGGSGGKGGGGKGGGGKGSQTVTSYNYKTACAMALCEGPIIGLGNVWISRDQLTYANAASTAKVPATLFLGTVNQAVWSTLQSNDPDNAIAFSSTAYLADAALDLGSSPTVPNYGYEVFGKFYNSGQQGDVNPADLINDFLTNDQYGVGFGPAVATAGSFVDAFSWGYYRNYCQATGIFLSPVLDSQEQVSSILDRWAQLTNTWIFWSGGLLKFVPLGEHSTSGNGDSFVPTLAAIYDLDYDDFIQDNADTPPIVETIIDPADRPNSLTLEIENRGFRYAAFPVRWQDDTLIRQYGRLPGSAVQAHDIKQTAVGDFAVGVIGRRAAYIVRTFAFRLPWRFSLLEPGDIVCLTDPHLGLDKFTVRIRTLDADKDLIWSVVAEECPAGICPSLTGTA